MAIDDDEGSLAAVRAKGNPVDDDEVVVIGQLEPDAVLKLALAPGDAVTYP